MNANGLKMAMNAHEGRKGEIYAYMFLNISAAILGPFLKGSNTARMMNVQLDYTLRGLKFSNAIITERLHNDTLCFTRGIF